MTATDRLALTYLRDHPAEAARSLERLPAAGSGALLDCLDPGIAAALLAHMGAPAAASCLEHMDPPQAAAALRRMRPAVAALILGAAASATSRRLMAHLEPLTRLRIQHLLGRAPDTVGALAQPPGLVLNIALTAGDAVRRIQQAPDGAGICELPVVDDDHRLAGTVEPLALIRAGARRPLRSLIRRPATALHKHMSLGDAREHPGWRDHRALPVIENDGTFIGTLDYRTLLEATAAHQDVPRTDAFTALLSLAGLYWLALAAILRLFTRARNTDPPRSIH